MFSRQKSASVSTAAQLRMMPSCEQSPARPFHSLNTPGTRTPEAATAIQLFHCCFIGACLIRPVCLHFGKRTKGDLFQLVAPDDQSNAVKRKNQMTTSSSKQPENQPTTHTPEQRESPARPTVPIEARLWPMPKCCVNGDKQPEAEAHIFVGGVRAPAPKE